MMSRNTLNFNSVCLALAGLHLFFVGAYPTSEPNLSLEEDRKINEKIEFLKLSQKGCSQAVFIHGQKELNCTISIWYTGTFPMWMLRNDIVRDLKKATVQELRTLPVQLCTCKKVQASDFCPAEAHAITNILLLSCNNSDQISSGVPVGGVVADLIKMVDDVKKLENISTVLDSPKTNNLKDVEINDNWKSISSPNDNFYSLGIKDDDVDITKARSNVKVITEEESKGINSEDEESIDDNAAERKHKDGQRLGDDDDNNENMKNYDSKLNVNKNGEGKRSVTQIKTTLKKHDVNVRKISVDSSMNVTDDDRNEDKKYENNEDFYINDKLTEDDLTKGKVSEKDKESDDEDIREENSDDNDEQETDNKDKTDGEINKAKQEYIEDDEIINKEITHNLNEPVDEEHTVTMAEDEGVETESPEGKENKMSEGKVSNDDDEIDH